MEHIAAAEQIPAYASNRSSCAAAPAPHLTGRYRQPSPAHSLPHFPPRRGMHHQTRHSHTRRYTPPGDKSGFPALFFGAFVSGDKIPVNGAFRDELRRDTFLVLEHKFCVPFIGVQRLAGLVKIPCRQTPSVQTICQKCCRSCICDTYHINSRCVVVVRIKNPP
ncbi:Uncharacterised protein [Yersinia pestis]|nr:Uncharacterised protein [Yersinia pestis]